VADVTSGKQDLQKYALRSTNITDAKSAKKNQNWPNMCMKKATKYVGKK
jgi:hypothetical protein